MGWSCELKLLSFGRALGVKDHASLPCAGSSKRLLRRGATSFHAITTFFLTFSPICLLNVVIGRSLSSCDTHFDYATCLSSSHTLSCYPRCCPAITSSSSLSCTCMFNIFLVVSSTPFLITCPYHISRLILVNVVIGSMLASLQMSSFFKWSFLVLSLAPLNILI